MVVENTNIQIDPSGLFTRLIAVVARSNTVEECFEYELTLFLKTLLCGKPINQTLLKLSHMM